MRTDYVDPELLGHLIYALTYENRLVCQVALKTGLRISDILSLRTDELKQRMTVTEHKTNKTKRITLGKDLFEQLKGIAGENFVFEHRTDPTKHRTRQAVYADLKRARKAFRIRANLAPHSLRKIYAVELFRRSDLEKVQEALNHDNVDVTLIYALADKLQKK